MQILSISEDRNACESISCAMGGTMYVVILRQIDAKK